MGLYRYRGIKDDFLFSAASIAHAHGISPNAVTALGLCFGVGAGAMLMLGQIPLGFAFILTSIFCDVLDGTIARKFNMETRLGRLFDSVSDRVCELAVVLGALAGGIIGPLGLLAIVGSVTLLVFRVLGERRGASTDYAVFGRAERLAFIMLGLLMPSITASTICFVVAGSFPIVSSLQIAVNLSR